MEVLKPDYKKNIQELRKIIYDEPMTSLEKAVFWTEYLIRHKSTKHLAYSGTNIPFYQKYFLDFITIALIVICLLCKLLQVTIKSILLNANEKVKTSWTDLNLIIHSGLSLQSGKWACKAELIWWYNQSNNLWFNLWKTIIRNIIFRSSLNEIKNFRSKRLKLWVFMAVFYESQIKWNA